MEDNKPTIVNSLGVTTPKYHESEKYNEWVKCFLDKKGGTYYNATQSAIKAYNYDPETQYMTAAQMGHKNIHKMKDIAHFYAEEHGLTLDKMLAFAASQMLKEDNPKSKEWWDSLMEMFGYKEDNKAAVEINMPVQINNEIQKELDKFR